MLEKDEILEIIKAVDESSIEELKLKHGETNLILKKKSTLVAPQTTVVKEIVQEQPVAKPEVHTIPTQVERSVTTQPKVEKVAQENLLEVKSPMVGTFYASSSPETPAFVTVGDKVKADTVVCILEAMKLFNEIQAEVKGEIVEILVENGQLVEYGQPLFLVKPE
jgi:acetyl-CoA carboxylase biotin carboxyl carrier protein